MNKAIVRLMSGFRRFKDKYFLQPENSVYLRLASQGQTPKTLMIGCSDSRVDPAILTDASPGELFVIRNVANLVPPCRPLNNGFHGTSSAIEFAVTGLKVENIVILGHRQCGGIRALMRGNADGENFVSRWMSIADQARENVLKKHAGADEETLCRHAEMEALKVSLQNLRSFPFVKEAMDKKQLNVVAVYFDLELGQLWEYDELTQSFRMLEI